MATAKAHTNIALVKYWGKKDQELIIPQTDSLSLTLNEFYTTTTVNFDNHLTSDLVAIDQQTLSKQAAKKVVHVLDDLFAKERQVKEASETVLEQIDLIKKSILARAFRGELGTNDPAEESALELIKQTLSETIADND